MVMLCSQEIKADVAQDRIKPIVGR